jgi:hypothetical protein
MNANDTLAKMRDRQRRLTDTPAAPPEVKAPADAAPKQAPAQAKKRKPKFPEFRLPAGSVFHAEYDGDRQQWHVVLTVPGLAPCEMDASSVHKCLIELGRRWFKQHGGATP